jgi:beta-aspartyl-peptidase (threonine type)
MRLFAAALTGLIALAAMTSTAAAAEKPKWAIVVHGGAGIIERKAMDPKIEAAYRAAMAAALKRGSDVLASGGSALDAIQAVITGMEDDPLFNAGKGAVFDATGKVELDSAVMDGKTLSAGAVAAVTTTRHPILAARAVMEKSGHVMLIGQGADAFAKSQGLEQVDNSFFYTERRWEGLVKELKAQGLPVPPKPAVLAGKTSALERMPDDHKYGTVGVVALDEAGNVAAGTSTGGTTAKRWGRVGDTPIIGAGTYASNQSCAVSGTGKGEYFIRMTVAREICALVQYKGMGLQQAADEVIQKRMPALMGKDGGVIAIAPDGQMAWSFNTSGMYRAKASSDSAPVVSIFDDEP